MRRRDRPRPERARLGPGTSPPRACSASSDRPLVEGEAEVGRRSREAGEMPVEMAEPSPGVVTERLEQLEAGPAGREHAGLGDRLLVLRRTRSDPQVMPPPTPYSRRPRLGIDHHRADRHVEPRRRRARTRPGARKPTAPQYTPARRVLELGDDLHRAHLGRARDRADGNSARNASSREAPGASSAETVDVSCQTVS